MSLKSVAAFQENLSDRVLSVDTTQYGGTIAVSTFPSQYPTFWLQADPNGVQDLCYQIDDSISYQTVWFKRSDNSNYSVKTVDFFGGRPVGR